MIHIKAKREKDGMITHLKSEFGNVFSREEVIKSMKKGFKYSIFNDTYEYLYMVENDNGIFLVLNSGDFIDRHNLNQDNIGDIAVF